MTGPEHYREAERLADATAMQEMPPSAARRWSAVVAPVAPEGGGNG